jgi:hypothetical protein
MAAKASSTSHDPGLLPPILLNISFSAVSRCLSIVHECITIKIIFTGNILRFTTKNSFSGDTIFAYIRV